MPTISPSIPRTPSTRNNLPMPSVHTDVKPARTTRPASTADGFDRVNDALDKTGKVIDSGNEILNKTTDSVERTTGLLKSLSELVGAVRSFIGLFKK